MSAPQYSKSRKYTYHIIMHMTIRNLGIASAPYFKSTRKSWKKNFDGFSSLWLRNFHFYPRCAPWGSEGPANKTSPRFYPGQTGAASLSPGINSEIPTLFSPNGLNPLTACTENILFYHFLLPHLAQPFKHVKDQMWHQLAIIWQELTSVLWNLNNFHPLEVVDCVSETQL